MTVDTDQGIAIIELFKLLRLLGVRYDGEATLYRKMDLGTSRCVVALESGYDWHSPSYGPRKV